MTTPYPKRLIEVDLPIKAISAHARREKSIRHGHISTLHLWWARRPLAACRAVLCASLWPDPVDENCPQAFRDAAAKILCEFAEKVRTDKQVMELCYDHWTRWKSTDASRLRAKDPLAWGELRYAMLDFIADFANWDATAVPAFLEVASQLSAAASPGGRPLVIDPFAGGGSIPLEGMRVGADVYASDLNPIPILLNEVILRLVPRYGMRLVETVRQYGEWVQAKAKEELSSIYPPSADGNTPIAYIWARVVRCEGPGCGAEVPLLKSLWLSKRQDRLAALRLIPNQSKRTLGVEIVNPSSAAVSLPGTVNQSAMSCPLCGYTTPKDRMRIQLTEQRGGSRNAQLMAVVVPARVGAGREYRLPNKADVAGYRAAVARVDELRKVSPSAVPDELLPVERVWKNNPIRVHLYGVRCWGDLFSPRQQLLLATYAGLVRRAIQDGPAQPDKELREGAALILALALSRLTDISNAHCQWSSSTTQILGQFKRQAISMSWDFAEAHPFSHGAAGNFMTTLSTMLEVLERPSDLRGQATVRRQSATAHALPDDSADALFTDPPYYDAVPYATLADFFYVWLKRAVPAKYASMFADELIPKDQECVVDEAKKKDHAFFEQTMTQALGEARRVVRPDGIAVVVFAHKSTAGWEAQLEAMLKAGWIITASWPIDTERENRTRAQNSAALASSVHLVCRPRENDDGSLRVDDVGSWRSVLAELPIRIHEWMPRLAEEGVVGADAIFACLGPALEVFSRYSRVEKASGEPVTLKEYLEQVWAAVSKEALSLMFEGADSTGLEEDARLTAMWLWTLGGGAATGTGADAGSTAKGGDDEADDDEDDTPRGKALAGFVLEYDAARKIAQGLGAHLEKLTDVVEVKGDKARLLSVAERTKALFGKDGAKEPEADRPKAKPAKKQLGLFAEIEAAEKQGFLGPTGVPKVGETTLDRLHQAMILFGAGRSDALKRFVVEEGAGKDPRFWKLAQSFSALYPPGSDEKRWVDGVLARKKGLGF